MLHVSRHLGFNAGGGSTTWNPADKATGVTLSNGNLTYTSDTSSNTKGVRATLARSTGKRTIRVTANTAQNGDRIGFANVSQAFGTFMGNDANGVGFSSTGAVFCNNVQIGNGGSWATGAVVDAVIDIDNKLLWVRVNGGSWNSSGTANPDTGTGGLSLSGLAAGPYYPALSTNSFASSQYTANFSYAATSTAPSWN